MSAANGSISQRSFPVPSRKERSSSRKLSLEEIDIIQTNKRRGYSDREIAKIVNRSLGVVGKYTRGMKADPFIVGQQPTPPTEHGQQSISSSEAKTILARLNKIRRLEADYEFSQSPKGRILLGNLKLIRGINVTLDTLGPKFGSPESQSLMNWRRSFQQKVETAIQHFRQGIHRSIESLEQCVACKHALTPFRPLA